MTRAERSTTEVLHDHLTKRWDGALEEDLRTNYSDDVVLLSSFGAFRGVDGVRESAKLLFEALGPSEFQYQHTLIEGRWGFLEWSATSADKLIKDGADGFVIENGLIVMQTVHYTIESSR